MSRHILALIEITDKLQECVLLWDRGEWKNFALNLINNDELTMLTGL